MDISAIHVSTWQKHENLPLEKKTQGKNNKWNTSLKKKMVKVIK